MNEPEDKPFTFEERDAAIRVLSVVVTYMTAAELAGPRRPDYIKAMHDLQHTVQTFKEKLAEDRAKAEQDAKTSARKGAVDDSGWTSDLINDEIAKMSEMLKGLNDAE